MDEIIPIAAIVGFFYTIVTVARTFSDYRTKSRLLAMNASPEISRLMLTREWRRNLFGDLRWGIVVISIGIGIMLGTLFVSRDRLPNDLEGPFGFAIVVVTAGIGLLVNYWVAGRLLKKQEDEQSSALSELESGLR